MNAPQVLSGEHRFHTEPATWIRDAQGRRLRTIDFHAHTISPAVERLVADRPQKKAELEIRLRTMGQASVEYNANVMLPAVSTPLSDLSVRVSDMDRMGVDMQVVSPMPTQYYYWADYDPARQIVAPQKQPIPAIFSEHPVPLIRPS